MGSVRHCHGLSKQGGQRVAERPVQVTCRDAPGWQMDTSVGPSAKALGRSLEKASLLASGTSAKQVEGQVPSECPQASSGWCLETSMPKQPTLYLLPRPERRISWTQRLVLQEEETLTCPLCCKKGQCLAMLSSRARSHRSQTAAVSTTAAALDRQGHNRAEGQEAAWAPGHSLPR